MVKIQEYMEKERLSSITFEQSSHASIEGSSSVGSPVIASPCSKRKAEGQVVGHDEFDVMGDLGTRKHLQSQVRQKTNAVAKCEAECTKKVSAAKGVHDRMQTTFNELLSALEERQKAKAELIQIEQQYNEACLAAERKDASSTVMKLMEARYVDDRSLQHLLRKSRRECVGCHEDVEVGDYVICLPCCFYVIHQACLEKHLMKDSTNCPNCDHSLAGILQKARTVEKEKKGRGA
jgi:hypothetical protein